VWGVVVLFVFGVRGFELRDFVFFFPWHGVHDKFEAVRRPAFLATRFSAVEPLCYEYSSHVPGVSRRVVGYAD
jgi:hypothetical protein